VGCDAVPTWLVVGWTLGGRDAGCLTGSVALAGWLWVLSGSGLTDVRGSSCCWNLELLEEGGWAETRLLETRLETRSERETRTRIGGLWGARFSSPKWIVSVNDGRCEGGGGGWRGEFLRSAASKCESAEKTRGE
jgi:hypothetical protein